MKLGNSLGAAVISAALLAIVFIANVTQEDEPQIASTTTSAVR